MMPAHSHTHSQQVAGDAPSTSILFPLTMEASSSDSSKNRAQQLAIPSAADIVARFGTKTTEELPLEKLAAYTARTEQALDEKRDEAAGVVKELSDGLLWS